MLPIVEFRVTARRVESYCMSCDQARAREYYNRRQARGNRHPPAERECPDCGRLLPAERFFADHRYRDGLAPTCLDCHNGVPTTRELRRRRLGERYGYLEPVLGADAFAVFLRGLLDDRVSGGEVLPPPAVGEALTRAGRGPRHT